MKLFLCMANLMHSFMHSKRSTSPQHFMKLLTMLRTYQLICLFRYNLMRQCWDASPVNRPTFHEIIDIIQDNDT